MKICYVANSRFPSERAHMTQVVAMCNAFVQNGHEVTLCVTDRKTDITEDPESFFGVPFLFTLKRIAVPDIAGRAPRIPVFLRPPLFLIQRVVFAFRAYREVQKGKFDLLYGRDEWILGLMSFFVKIPIVWESHEAKFSRISQTLIKRVKKLVVISEGIRDFYLEHGVPPSMIHVAHDGIDERFFLPLTSQKEAQVRLGITTEKPIVMYIGEFDAWKGVGTLFGAVAENDPFDVYVIGGRKPEDVEVLQKQHPKVHFLGPRPYKELPVHQQAADILVLPNTGKNLLASSYTSPLKLFTYMTAKKPIVASRIPSVTNVLSEDEAYFFTADDAHSLRVTVDEIIAHPHEAEQKAERAFKKSKKYAWKERAREILQNF